MDRERPKGYIRATIARRDDITDDLAVFRLREEKYFTTSGEVIALDDGDDEPAKPKRPPGPPEGMPTRPPHAPRNALRLPSHQPRVMSVFRP